MGFLLFGGGFLLFFFLFWLLLFFFLEVVFCCFFTAFGVVFYCFLWSLLVVSTSAGSYFPPLFRTAFGDLRVAVSEGYAVPPLFDCFLTFFSVLYEINFVLFLLNFQRFTFIFFSSLKDKF